MVFKLKVLECSVVGVLGLGVSGYEFTASGTVNIDPPCNPKP